jgi:hypothetical protein
MHIQQECIWSKEAEGETMKNNGHSLRNKKNTHFITSKLCRGSDISCSSTKFVMRVVSTSCEV